jgi:3-keto-L-gulonate-6-phosphate decarboxylase
MYVEMRSNDDVRFMLHQTLLDLDATTNQLMMSVVANEISGDSWNEALMRQKLAFEAWISIAGGVQTDPMPALDGRPPEGAFPQSRITRTLKREEVTGILC